MKSLACFVVGLILGAFVAATTLTGLRNAETAAIDSNRWALETDLRKSIDDYHGKNGHYPDSLAAVDMPSWIQSEDRKKMLLKAFYYENRGDTYVLWFAHGFGP